MTMDHGQTQRGDPDSEAEHRRHCEVTDWEVMTAARPTYNSAPARSHHSAGTTAITKTARPNSALFGIKESFGVRPSHEGAAATRASRSAAAAVQLGMAGL
mmetsp:Transcript_11282/g.34765  ORF Transcript_11282/g.34765 Transcript_11282/m.34765 type:complete len:101 (+) Transcript_11282:120-422(+)